MESDWNFYQCRVDGNPASIYLDLGWAKAAPAEGLTHMAYVRLHMRRPRPDGLSSQDEYEVLIALEDDLIPKLQEHGSVAYVGRNTSGGCRDFYFYSVPQDDWEGKVSSAMRAHPGYEHECGIREDRDWATYFEFLYPDDRSRQAIENRNVCEVLQERGDDLQKVRDIDHWAYFRDPASRERFAALAGTLGFQVEERMEPSEGSEYGIRLRRPDAPARIDDANLALFDAAIETGGNYDGWETYVVE